MTDRARIAEILREVGALLELRGENPFRVRAFENGARAIEGVLEEPSELVAQGRIAEVKGIGPGLAANIAEIVSQGKLALHEELRAEISPGIRDLMGLPGLGPKRLRQVIDELKVDSIAELETACRDGRLAKVKGFGEKSQESLLRAIAHRQEFKARHLLPEAERVAALVEKRLREVSCLEELSVAGSLRRRRETIGDLDFVASGSTQARAALAQALAEMPEVEEVLAHGETKVAVRLTGGFQVDLRLVDPDEFAAALHHFTGSKEHNIALRSRAKGLGLTVNEYGVFRGDDRLRVPDEQALYRLLGLTEILPELREGFEEIALAEKDALPELVRLADLRGTLHVHTDWSDGIAPLAEMAAAARRVGWEYLGIADHSRSAAYAGGLSIARVREQWKAIDVEQAAHPELRLFKGTECDILADGALDFPDELLLDFDYVVASIHSRFQMSEREMTERLVAAVSHPCVTFLGHPTGRLLLQREGYAFDFDAVLDAAERNGVIVEVNANPHRLDLDWRVLRGWLARGQRTSIHPDAHSPQGLADVRYGIDVARKAGATKESVLNTNPTATLERYFAARMARARRELAGER